MYIRNRDGSKTTGRGTRTKNDGRAVVERFEDRTLFTANVAGFSESTFGTPITQGTAMEFAPDGRLFVATQTGQIRVVKNGQTLATPFATVVTQSDVERGLLGITLDPNFSQNGYVYIYYTAQTPTFHNRISRFTADPAHPDVALAGSEHVLMELPTVASPSHNSGSLHFGPDGKLYVSVGENAVPTQAQQQNSVFGKILRINKDGSIPTDNPFYNSNTGVAKAVWAMGLRNPFTFGFQSGTGKMFINDVGQDTWEEINLGKAGANYGWPNTEGFASNPLYTNPLYTYKHPFDTSGNRLSTAIAGAQFYNPPAGVSKPFPSSYTGKFFFGDAPSGTISVMDPANPGTATKFASNLWYVVDVDLGPDGSIYVLSRGGGYSNKDVPGRVQKFTYSGSVAPSIGTNPADVLVSENDSATFSVDASGTGLTYQWQRNKTNIQGATAATYKINSTKASDNGAKFRVIVTNSSGSATSTEATLTVSTVAAPTPFITLPATGLKFVSGQPVQFSGGAGDGNGGTLPTSQLDWSISYTTGSIERPFIESIPGVTSGEFTPGTITPYLQPNVYYRVQLTATNSAGVSRSVYVDVLPVVVNLTMQSNIPGAQLTLDGVPVTAGYSTEAVAGLSRPIAAPAFQSVNGVNYEFESWSDGGAADHTASTPTSNVTYTANYKVSTKQTFTRRADKDAYVRDGSYAGQNFGASTEIQVKNDAVDWNRNSYLSFDLTNLGDISFAKLRLYAKLDNGQTPNTNVTLYDVTGAWTEAGLIYNNKPAASTTPLGSFTVANTTAKYYEIDLTDYLKAKKAAGATSVDLMLASGVGKSTVVISSDEAASNRPELVILADSSGGNPDPGDPGDPDPGDPDPGTPTTVTLHASEDAHVRDGLYAGQNFGTDTNLQIKNDAVDWNRQSYLKFNLSTLGDITSAKLRLYAKLDNTLAPNVGVSLYDVTGAWSENAITYNTKPSAVGSAIGTFTVVGTSAKYYEIDLTAYLQAKKTAGATSVEIVLQAPNVAKSTVLITSDESATNRPELVISSSGSVSNPEDPGDPQDPEEPTPTGPAHIRAVADAYVRNGTYGSTNYGPFTELQVKNHSAVGYSREAYLRFDLTSVTTVTSAKLRMYGSMSEAASAQTAVYTSSDVSWLETGVTWNGRIAQSTAPVATVTVTGTAKQWYEWDLTGYIAAQKAAGKSSVTLVLRNLNQTDATLVFASDEAAANRPELVIA